MDKGKEEIIEIKKETEEEYVNVNKRSKWPQCRVDLASTPYYANKKNIFNRFAAAYCN
jgi:hypothetical protein